MENIDAFNILAAFLSGVQITYQGEEIGQENGKKGIFQISFSTSHYLL